MSQSEEFKRLKQRMTALRNISPTNFKAVLLNAREDKPVSVEGQSSASWEEVTKLLGILSRTYRFENSAEKEAPAYHYVLDELEPWQIRQAGELCLKRHVYPTMPKPAQLYEWASEITPDAEARAWAVKGSRITAENVEWETDEHGNEVARIKR
jgi:hypothetical protein